MDFTGLVPDERGREVLERSFNVLLELGTIVAVLVCLVDMRQEECSPFVEVLLPEFKTVDLFSLGVGQRRLGLYDQTLHESLDLVSGG
jgi:hypothetical protein